MDRKKIIYIGIVLIIAVITSITYFSYGFWTNRSEQHGKLNIVAGTLDYKITATGVTNNAITVGANSVTQLAMNVQSLNSINSKYGLYYQVNDPSVKVYYLTGSNPLSNIVANGTVVVNLVIVNDTSTSQDVTFSINGGFVNNELQKVQGTEDIVLGTLASEVSYDNTTTGLSCTTAQCAIDEISNLIDNN